MMVERYIKIGLIHVISNIIVTNGAPLCGGKHAGMEYCTHTLAFLRFTRNIISSMSLLREILCPGGVAGAGEEKICIIM